MDLWPLMLKICECAQCHTAHSWCTHTFPSSVLACCKVTWECTLIRILKFTNTHTQTDRHTRAHTHSRQAKANTLSLPTRHEEWQSTTFFHQQPKDSLTPPPPPLPQLTSDLDDNKLSSPSLLLGKHRKLANTQNAVPILSVCACVYLCVSVRPRLCPRFLSILSSFWFVLCPAFFFFFFFN